jgi:hypothetical protein
MTGKTLNGKCGDCDNVFVVVHLPMPLDKGSKTDEDGDLPSLRVHQDIRGRLGFPLNS